MAYRIDLTPNASYTETVSVSQDDVGREIVVDLYKDGTAYTPTTGTTITMQGTKPSGLGYTITGTASGSSVTFLTTLEMTQEAGRFASEIVLTNGATVIGTANFALYVEKNPHPESTIDGTGETMQNLTVRMDELEDRVEDIESGGGGLTDGVKAALLQIAQKVAYIDENGQDYYDALEEALYPPATLVRITARYTQSGTVYDNQSLDDLKSDLVVTAIYDNGTSEAVTTYTLSGSLVTGESVITAAYGGKTATFTVTVTHATVQYSITNTLTNCTNSNSATAVNEETAYTGTLTADSDYVMGTVSITMGGTDITSTAYDSATGAISITSVTGNIVITAVATEPPITVTSGLPLTLGWNSGSTNLVLSETLGAQGDTYTIELYFNGLVDTASSGNTVKVQTKGGSDTYWLFDVTLSNITVTAEQVANQKITYSGALNAFNAGATALGVAYATSGVKLTDVKMYKG